MIKNYLNKITGLIVKSCRFLFFVFIITIFVKAQSPTNLERFYSAVDSAASSLISDLANTKEVKLELTLGSFYSVFANPIRSKLLKNGIAIRSDESSSENITNLNFVIDDCNVVYGKPERDGIFGSFYSERIIKVTGSYFISAESILKNFNIALKDTVKVDDIEKLENRSYPFTQGDIPPEPFFSSLLEPVVAVGAAAITIILFFSVRSK